MWCIFVIPVILLNTKYEIKYSIFCLLNHIAYLTIERLLYQPPRFILTFTSNRRLNLLRALKIKLRRQCDAFLLFMLLVCGHLRERADLLAPFMMFNCVFVTFPCDILGQMWYLIVSIPDFFHLSYLV